MANTFVVHAGLLAGHMMMVGKKTSIVTGRRIGDLAEIATRMRKRGVGAQVGTGQGGMVLRAEKQTKVIQPLSRQMRKEQSWA